MASEATKMAVRGNMHMGTRVMKVADFNSEVKYTSEAVWRPPWTIRPP